MLKTFEKFNHLNEKVLGIDLDGVLNDFAESFNCVYSKCFPGNKFIPSNQVSDWYWYHSLDYNGMDPYKWIDDHRYEMWKNSKPYVGAVETMREVYEYTQNNGILVRIVTCQPGKNAQQGAMDWIRKYKIPYDDISFVPRSLDKWDQSDVQVDDAPHVLDSKPMDKVSIRVIQRWNLGNEGDFNISDITLLSPQLVEEAFEKLINING
jgi:uncharacterized HAD superfamily protein